VLYACKRAVKREDTIHGSSYAYGHTADYPMDPKDLTKAMYNHVFGTEAPVRCVEPRFSQISFVSRIKFLRASSSVVKSDAACSSPTAAHASAVNPQHMMAQMMAAMVAQFTSPNITLCPPARALSASVAGAPLYTPMGAPMAVLMPPQEPQQQQLQPPLASIEDASVGALAEMRREMAMAHSDAPSLGPRRQTKLKTLKGNAKAAAALDTSASADEGGTDDDDAADEEAVAVATKRPACAATAKQSTRKRPAAALLNTRKTVTSRAYDTCYRTLIAKGKTVDAAKTAARKAYSVAASKYDANA
jgi:hypothetical protein